MCNSSIFSGFQVRKLFDIEVNTIISDEFAYPSRCRRKPWKIRRLLGLWYPWWSHAKHIPSAAFSHFVQSPAPFMYVFFSFRLSSSPLLFPSPGPHPPTAHSQFWSSFHILLDTLCFAQRINLCQMFYSYAKYSSYRTYSSLVIVPIDRE